ncbi:hypothetical protein KIW84_021448 [Lathyrus oleraceus]|uniref:Uncharacterized protein n=1 Tax=Pisum sativum TaxID=3888 RepID=A0A9D5B9B9_PEA|nr:hypothetical protein KIW84_021448 [Pisum sativum]
MALIDVFVSRYLWGSPKVGYSFRPSIGPSEGPLTLWDTNEVEVALPCTVLDHCPIMMTIDEENWGLRPTLVSRCWPWIQDLSFKSITTDEGVLSARYGEKGGRLYFGGSGGSVWWRNLKNIREGVSLVDGWWLLDNID